MGSISFPKLAYPYAAGGGRGCWIGRRGGGAREGEACSEKACYQEEGACYHFSYTYVGLTSAQQDEEADESAAEPKAKPASRKRTTKKVSTVSLRTFIGAHQPQVQEEEGDAEMAEAEPAEENGRKRKVTFFPQVLYLTVLQASRRSPRRPLRRPRSRVHPLAPRRRRRRRPPTMRSKRIRCCLHLLACPRHVCLGSCSCLTCVFSLPSPSLSI